MHDIYMCDEQHQPPPSPFFQAQLEAHQHAQTTQAPLELKQEAKLELELLPQTTIIEQESDISSASTKSDHKVRKAKPKRQSKSKNNDSLDSTPPQHQHHHHHHHHHHNHNHLTNQMEPLDLSNGHRCVECTRSFRAVERLRAHQRRHDIKKSGRYTCDLCHKPFVQQSSLITHKRIHTGEKPYHCKICDNSYGDLSTFTKHLRTHTGEKPYKCEYCDQRFSQSGNCLRHKRSVHAHLFNSKTAKKLNAIFWIQTHAELACNYTNLLSSSPAPGTFP